MDADDRALTPVAWLIDEDTEHARVLIGSTWQPSKMGAYNKLLVTLLDAQEATHRAVLTERERCAQVCAGLSVAAGRLQTASGSLEGDTGYECSAEIRNVPMGLLVGGMVVDLDAPSLNQPEASSC